MLHGGSETRVAAVGVAESGSVDVERGVLGREGRRRQGVGRVSEGWRLPHAAAAAASTAAAGRLVQRELLVLERQTGSDKYVNTTDVLETLMVQDTITEQTHVRDTFPYASSWRRYVIRSRRRRPGCSQPWRR